MNLLIHIGLNKAASTWLQHSLATNNSTEIFYKRLHPYFRNHWSLYNLIKERKNPDAIAWIEDYANFARLTGAKCAVISSEDIWQELPFNSSAASVLETARNRLQQLSGITTRYLIIKRDFQKWAFSYCSQLINNAGCLSDKTLQDFFQSSVNLAQFPIIAAKQLPPSLVDVISCDEPGLDAKVQSILNTSFKGLQDHVNVSRSNEMALAILSGSLRAVYSFSNELHVNGEDADSLIERFQTAWDEMLSNKKSDQFCEIITQYDFEFRTLLQGQISTIYANLSKAERWFWEQ
jgi:hypothetical protein